MAKRFTDTGKWDKGWFRKLPVKMKVAWEYLRDKCDHAGVWAGDFELMSFQVGDEITSEECIEHFGEERFIPLDSGKFFLPTFVEFQYGDLNPANKAHKSVIHILEKEGASKPLGSPLEGAKDKDKDKDKDKEKDKEQEKEKEKSARIAELNRSTSDCVRLYKSVLNHFGIERGLLPGEDHKIGTAVQRYGAENVLLAFAGAKAEKPIDNFNPAEHVSLARILDPAKLEGFVNRGAKARKASAVAEEKHRRAVGPPAENEGEWTAPPPELAGKLARMGVKIGGGAA